MAPLTKKKFIDQIVFEATGNRFFGDGRDGEAPPMSLINFTHETWRYGAKVLRARLSNLSYVQILREHTNELGHQECVRCYQQLMEKKAVEAEREAKARESRRQVAAAIASRRSTSQAIYDLVAKFAGPVLNSHPKCSSNRCADLIERPLNAALRAEGRPPLKLDAIRKRVEKFRTQAR